MQNSGGLVPSTVPKRIPRITDSDGSIFLHKRSSTVADQQLFRLECASSGVESLFLRCSKTSTKTSTKYKVLGRFGMLHSPTLRRRRRRRNQKCVAWLHCCFACCRCRLGRQQIPRKFPSFGRAIRKSVNVFCISVDLVIFPVIPAKLLAPFSTPSS